MNKITAKVNLIVLSLVFGVFSPESAIAHGGHSSVESNTHADEIGKESRWTLSADLRPSVNATGVSYFLDNEIGLGYSFSPSVFVGYNQRFQIAVQNADMEHEEEGPDFHEHHDGFFQVNVNDIARLGSGELSFDAKVFTPTSDLKRQRGFLTAFESAVKLSVPLTTNLSLCVTEGPVLHAFSSAEYAGDAGLVTNPFLENRFSAGLDASFFSQKLRLSLPIFWQEFLHHTSQQSAKFSGSWSHVVWISPEIIYNLDQHSSVGLSYHSENLLADYLYQVALADGLKGGSFQMVYQVRL